PGAEALLHEALAHRWEGEHTQLQASERRSHRHHAPREVRARAPDPGRVSVALPHRDTILAAWLTSKTFPCDESPLAEWAEAQGIPKRLAARLAGFRGSVAALTAEYISGVRSEFDQPLPPGSDDVDTMKWKTVAIKL